MVVEQIVQPPSKEAKTRQAKAIASKTKAMAVAERIANMTHGDFHGNQYREVSANLPILSQ